MVPFETKTKEKLWEQWYKDGIASGYIPHLYVFIPILGMFSSSTLYTNTTVVCTNIAHIWTEVMIWKTCTPPTQCLKYLWYPYSPNVQCLWIYCYSILLHTSFLVPLDGKIHSSLDSFTFGFSLRKGHLKVCASPRLSNLRRIQSYKTLPYNIN